MKDYENIELRSEKVKNIIGKIPSPLVRSGISLISVILLGLVTVSALIPYTQSVAVTTEINFSLESHKARAVSLIPYSYISQIRVGSLVQIELEGYHSHLYGTLEAEISAVEKDVIKVGRENFFQVTIDIMDRQDKTQIDLKDGVVGIGYILLSDDTILKHITKRFFN